MTFTARTTLAAIATLTLMACNDATAPQGGSSDAPLLAKGGKGGGGESGAGNGGGQTMMTICHVGDDGRYVMLTVAAPGAANHLAKHAGDRNATLSSGSYSCPARP